jgi:hypothetical protein
MLTQYIRIFKGAAAGSPEVVTLTDVSMENAEKAGFSISEKYLYIGQKFPFNNIFMLMGAKLNTITSKMKIEYWNGAEEWVEAKDILDFSRGLKQHGLVQFSLDNDFSWDRMIETDTDETQVPAELQGKSINDCYWIRISFDVAPDCVTTVPAPGPDTHENVIIKYLAYAFTTTEKINSVDTQASKYYETFLSGKTNWLDEILIGSEMMISDMKSAGLLKGHGEIILLDDFYLPCAWRVLEHIYSQMGTAYDGKRGECKGAYKNFLKGPKTLDSDKDGKINLTEQQSSTTRLIR